MTEVCADAPEIIDLSWSRLKNYTACHQRTKLLRERRRTKVYDGRVFLPGTLADLCMRRWLEEGKFDSGGMVRFLEEAWDQNTGSAAQYKINWRGDPTKDRQEVVDTVKRALETLEPFLMEKVVPFPFQPEFRFKAVWGVPHPDGRTVYITVLGAVDVAVHFGDGRYGLYDLKITEKGDYIRSTLGQLTFYDIAFYGYTGVKPVEHAFLTPLLPEKVIRADVTDVERRDMAVAIVNYCHGIWSGNWDLTPDTRECYRCPVKHACPRWVNPISKDTQGRNRMTFERAEFTVEQVDLVEDDDDV